jgi:non-homologous end joining protein Ku
MEHTKVDQIRKVIKEYNGEKKDQFTAMSYADKFKRLLEELVEDEPLMDTKEFKQRLQEAEESNDWRDIYEILSKEQEPNQESISYKEMPLSNIAIEYLSELAHNNVMENVSYEDYLTEDQAEVYRLALSI